MTGKSLIAALALFSAPVHSQEPGTAAHSPDRSFEGWETAEPVELGFDQGLLEQLDTEIEAGEWGNVHALLIERHGKIVFERYYTGPDWSYGRSRGTVRFGSTSLHDIRSNGKTLVALAIGIARSKGLISDLDAPLADYLPHRASMLAGAKGAITLRHLLTMTSGLEWDEWSQPYGTPQNSETLYRASADPNGWALSQPLVHRPGTTFAYSHASTQLLVEVVETATNQPFEDFLDRELLRPLGIRDTGWAAGEIAGLPDMAGALRLNARDMAKLGRLLANRGAWGGSQLVPEEFIADMVIPRSAPDPVPGAVPAFVKSVDYGLQIWSFIYSTPAGAMRVPAFSGNGEQRTTLLPHHDVVVTMFAGNYGGGGTPQDVWMPDRMLVEAILPAITDH